jgi:hypothetical protein
MKNMVHPIINTSVGMTIIFASTSGNNSAAKAKDARIDIPINT